MLSGPIPSAFGKLTALTDLQLSENALSGSLPSELGLLDSLVDLGLSTNQLTGQIPTEIGMMTSLKTLLLQNNSLSGTLPSQLSSSVGLRLDGNEFSGTVPGHLCPTFWCDCTSNVTFVSSCTELTEGPPSWPGRVPAVASAVMLNILTDDWQDEISWLWQQETNETGVWITLDESGALPFSNHLHSTLFSVRPNARYRLVLSDSWGDGLHNGHSVPGWATLLAANGTVLYSIDGSDFLNITIDVFSGAGGSIEDIVVVVDCDEKRFSC